ncbi:MAG: polysaccharide biosynthesis/export family protein [Thermoguttaceae bacterium]|jgi:autotransporter-associated beta strand protein
MPTHTLIHRGLLLIVLSAGVGCAGAVFAADDEAGEWFKKAGVEIPRELAMRPLPTYRIEPPDIIQIEVTCAKAGRGGENQPAKKSDEVKPSGSAATESGSSSLNVTGAVTPGENKTGGGILVLNGAKYTGNSSGTITLSGTPAENVSGSGRISASANIIGSITPSETEYVFTGTLPENNTVGTSPSIRGWTPNSGESLNKVSTGTLTLSGANNYSGTTTTFSSGDTYSGTTTVSDRGEMRLYQPGMGGPPLVLGNAPPSSDSITIKSTGRGMSGADLGSGQYLVGPDGTINMRQYGTVQVTGMTIAEVKAALEKHLSKYMESPEVWVDVLGHNSKVFYVITDGAGSGDNVRRIPITGNETVLDAIAAIGGLSQFSSKKIWISRPSATNSRKGTILTVDYTAITQRGATETNYQIMPGDRIFIAPDSAIAINVKLGKVTAPVERMMGVIGLGSSTIRSVKKLMGEDKDHQGPDEDEW